MESTLDEPAHGLKIAQPRRGFRYGAEAFWLAGFALEGGSVRTVLDLGTGSGIVALLLASRGLEVLGIDVRAEWGPLWEQTLKGSQVSGSIRLEHADVADGVQAAVDLVVSNPPFYPAGSGPHAADAFKRAARTESTAPLSRFVEVALNALVDGGRACFVVPVHRQDEVLMAAERMGAGGRRVIRVGKRRVLIELVQGIKTVPIESCDESDPRVRAWYAAVSEAPWRE